MSKKLYTPGPWEAVTMSGVHGQTAIMARSPEFDGEDWPYHPKIASVACMRGGPPREIGEANARLISVSPKMFECLENIKKAIEFMPKGIGRGAFLPIYQEICSIIDEV